MDLYLKAEKNAEEAFKVFRNFAKNYVFPNVGFGDVSIGFPEFIIVPESIKTIGFSAGNIYLDYKTDNNDTKRVVLKSIEDFEDIVSDLYETFISNIDRVDEFTMNSLSSFSDNVNLLCEYIYKNLLQSKYHLTSSIDFNKSVTVPVKNIEKENSVVEYKNCEREFKRLFTNSPYPSVKQVMNTLLNKGYSKKHIIKALIDIIGDLSYSE